MSRLPVLALTMGDPAGIGPELAVKAAASPELAGFARLVLYGCPDIIKEACRRFAPSLTPETVPVGNLKFSEIKTGIESAVCGLAARDAIIKAVKDVISGEMDAIVTAPVNKASINLAGIPFTGHTELIAELCGTENFAMMQSSGNLRVIFVTTHIALAEVAKSITAERIVDVTKLLHESIMQEGISKPKIAMAAINPHAGENGFMGEEDEKVVKPAVAQIRSLGIDIEGPFPPDTLFIEKIRNRFDGIVSMYHDQGHIPFKMLAFDSGVNSTMGLPLIRTSPDHGTAFEIAWKGIADTGSFFAAVRLAAKRASSFMQ